MVWFFQIFTVILLVIPGNHGFWIFLDRFVDEVPEQLETKPATESIAALIKQRRPWAAKWELDSLKSPGKEFGTVLKQLYRERSVRNPSEKLASLLVEYTLDGNSSKSCSIIGQGLAGILHECETNFVPVSSTALIAVDHFKLHCSGARRDSAKLVNGLTTAIMQKWTEQIHHQDYWEVSQFCSQFDKIPIFKRHLKDMVRSAYANKATNLNSISNFLNGRYCDDEVTLMVWSSLLNVSLEEDVSGFNSNILKISEWIWQWETFNRIKLPGNIDLKSQLTAIHNQIPEKLRKLVWNGWCTFKNFKTGKYILASKNGTKHLFMEYSIGPGSGGRLGDNEGWWYLQKTLKPAKSKFKAPDLTFSIKTLEFIRNRPYLCANNTKTLMKKDKPHQYQSTATIETCYKSGSRRRNMLAQWVLEPVQKPNELGVNAKLFQVYAFSNDRRLYLYQVPGNPAKQEIVAGGNEIQSQEESFWDIDCK